MLYRRARKLDPGQSRYPLFLARAYLHKALADEAQPETWLARSEEALTAARELSPLDPEVDGHLGQLYQFRAGLTADSRGEKTEDLELAVAYYRKASRQSPTVQASLLQDARLAAHRELAAIYAEEGKTEEALQHAKHARELAPKDERANIDSFIERLEHAAE